MFRRVVREHGWSIDPNHYDYQSALSACSPNSVGIAVRSDGRLTVNPQRMQEYLEAMLTIDGYAAQPKCCFLMRGQTALRCLHGHLGSTLDDRESLKYYRAALAGASHRLMASNQC